MRRPVDNDDVTLQILGVRLRTLYKTVKMMHMMMVGLVCAFVCVVVTQIQILTHEIFLSILFYINFVWCYTNNNKTTPSCALSYFMNTITYILNAAYLLLRPYIR